MTSQRTELDNELHSTETPPLWHFDHPTEPGIAWCGAVLTGRGVYATHSLDEIGCVVCVDLWRAYGSAYWWRLHNGDA